MVASSSSSKSRLPTAARLSSSCSTDDAPTSTDVTRVVAQRPGQRQLRQRLTAAGGDVVQRPDVVERLVGEQVGGQRAAAGRPGVGRDAVQVAVGQHALGQRRERDAADAQLSRVSSRPSSTQRFSIEYDGWWISSGVPRSARIAAARSVRSGE